MLRLVPSSWRRLALRLLPGSLLELIRSTRMRAQRRRALAAIAAAPPASRIPHQLTGELIISFTSYPARFDTLPLTIASLMRQTMQCDRLILWLSAGDASSVPAEVEAFTSQGLEIRICDDLKSYKKLIPALETFPDAYIVTADDDLYFPPEWLEILVGVVMSCRSTDKNRLEEILSTTTGQMNFLWSLSGRITWHVENQERLLRRMTTDPMASALILASFAPDQEMLDLLDRNFRRVLDRARW